MENLSRIGNLNYIGRLSLVHLKRDSGIGNLNYITGFPVEIETSFAHLKNRKCQLILHEHSGITGRHYVDCTCGVSVGAKTTVAGIRSIILTHSIDVRKSIQSGAPICIGKSCFLGACCTLLPGVTIADSVLLGAGSVVPNDLEQDNYIYAGNPAKAIRAHRQGEYLYGERESSNVS